jgi:NAD(P)-dependent dehydrogenase (short-subunit alcohol dehydrogenase family)
LHEPPIHARTFLVVGAEATQASQLREIMSNSQNQRCAVVTGAGSGVGRATALRLLQDGWHVALVGRREDALRETAQLAGSAGERALVCPCDVGKPADVDAMAQRVLSRFPAVSVLVNAAGTNLPARSLDVLSVESFQQLIDINLTGSFLCARAFLPGMRNRGEGTIVNVVSDAGLQASAKAGAGYAASKFGQRGLTQSINAEERGRGIRACAILPGDIDTPLLEKRPEPPPAEARRRMLRAEDVAECAMLAINLPPHAVVEELLIRPR